MFTEDNKMIIKSMSSKDFYSFIEIKDDSQRNEKILKLFLLY